MTPDKLATFARSKKFTQGLYILGGILVLVLVFEGGIALGYRKAEFDSHWGENYSRNFGGPDRFGMDTHMPIPHGVFGSILSISSSTITIANPQQPEQKVVIDDSTLIRDHEDSGALSDLKIGTYIVVLGSPDPNGEVLAKLIRIIPAPATSTSRVPPQP